MANKIRTPLISLGVVIALMGAATIWKMSRSDNSSDTAGLATATTATMQSAPLAQGEGPDTQRRPSSGRSESPGQSRQHTREEIAAFKKDRTAKAARAYDLAGQLFVSQRVDPVWSAKTEQGLQKLSDNPAFAQVGAQPKDLQVACKSSLCQIKGQFASDREARDWTQIYMTNVGNLASMGRVRFYPNPDGSTQVRIYSYK